MTFLLMNKVTLTQTNVILSSDTTKLSLEKLIGEIAKMDSELKEVKEKMCTSTAPVAENKDEGQLNYTIKVFLLKRIFSCSQHVRYVRESDHPILKRFIFQFKQLLEESLQSAFIPF